MATVKTKYYFAEQVLKELNSQFRNRDEKISPRQVIVRMDAIVNYFAKMNIFESWNMGEKHVDDQYITTWDGRLNSWIPITDPAAGESYFTIPANYVALPKNSGIIQVYLEKNYFDPIAILNAQEVLTIRNTMAGNMQGRLAVYVRGGRIYFKDRKDIKVKFGDAGIQLVIRDSGTIADDAPYPIDASMEQMVIDELVKWFRQRKNQGADLAKDAVDNANK